MKCAIITGILFVFSSFVCSVPLRNIEPARAVQIVRPDNHTHHLELDDLKTILEADDIKDRHVVVVSIAGAFRKGKSFLLNFFIRYLNAEYKKHDISDWLEEESNASGLVGFKWRGGRKPETIGIWMWSEVFTHDFENGEKVAIILLDTQGLFDSQSSVEDSTVTFALSMLLSSVQCYNVMANIQEDDLNHLRFFTKYAQMVQQESNEKPFQNLLFIVRDYPFADETGYGWNGTKVIDEILSENDAQTPEMRDLRKDIRSSFEEINAYLMPHPGLAVTQQSSFTGSLQQIEPKFLQHVKELVPSLFAPEHLVMKKLNGEKLRARDLVQYLQRYIDLFNNSTLPKPSDVYSGTLDTFYVILAKDCVNNYVTLMRNSLNGKQSYSNAELKRIHDDAKNSSLTMFEMRKKLVGKGLIESKKVQIENDIQEQYQNFVKENNEKRKTALAELEHFMENLVNETAAKVNKYMYSKVNVENDLSLSDSGILGTVSYLNTENFQRAFEMAKEIGWKEFNSKVSTLTGDNNALVMHYVSKLNKRLKQLRKRWWDQNNAKAYEFYRAEVAETIDGAMTGAIVGAVGGNSAAGATFGAVTSGLFSVTKILLYNI